MTPDSDMMALAEKLGHKPQEPLTDSELKMVRRVVRTLEALSVFGVMAKGILIAMAGIAAAVLYWRDFWDAVRKLLVP